MTYNFDEIVHRWDTDSIKYDGPKTEGYTQYIPMWVADMDFRTPQPILDSIQKMLENGVLGYTLPPTLWAITIRNWLLKKYDWTIDPKELVFAPGIVRGLTFAIRCFTEPGDKILIMSPVYPPFFSVPERNKRQLVTHKLQIKNNQFHINFEQFEQDVKQCKLFVLCNPHNPGGRVWLKEELEQMATICKKHNVLVISDEIHADLTLPAHTHHPFASVSDAAKQNSIVFMAPSKTFNMPGLVSSYAIIPNGELRKQYTIYVEDLDVASGHMFSYRPLIAAYTECDAWLEQAINYIQGNIDYVRDYLANHLSRIKMIEPQASYLIFLDCRELKLNDQELRDFFEKKAGLLLNPGITFGPEGSGFMRLNIGCPKSIVQKAMKQLEVAYKQL